MTQRVFFLNTLREGVAPADYEHWVQTVDYPIARKQAAPFQLAGQLVNQSDQLAVADRYAIGGDDQRRRVRPPACRRLDQIGDAQVPDFAS